MITSRRTSRAGHVPTYKSSRNQNCLIWSLNTQRRNLSENHGVYETVLVKRIVETFGGMISTFSLDCILDATEGYFVRGNELSGSTKSGNFLEYVRDYQHVHNNFAPKSSLVR